MKNIYLIYGENYLIMYNIKTNSLKNNILYGLFWKMIERIGVQGIQFIVQVILARLLLPEEYGTVALITIFITVSNIFIQGGFGSALIQKKKVDNKDYSSVFYFNIIISIILYLVLFLLSPIVADFYNVDILKGLLRVQAFTLIIGSFGIIQNVIIQRNMDFKKLSYISFASIIIQGVVGISMAYSGFGVWSLVFSNLTSTLVTTILLWIVIKWKPMLSFSLKRLKSLFEFGSKILLSGLIDTIYNNLYSLIIGKVYSQKMLGFYNRGQNIPNLVITNINASIDGVLFPALSTYQDDKKRIRELTRRAIVTSSFLIFPAMFGLMAVSKSVIIILITDKWIDSVPFMQLSCIALAMWPIHTANLQAIKSMGYSNIYLKLEIIKKCLGIILIIISLPYGVYGLVLSSVISSILCTFINAYPNKKLLSYSFKDQLKDILPSLILSIFMSIIVYSITFLELGILITLIIQIFIGALIYILGAKIFKFECFEYLLKTIREFKENK